MGTDTESCGKSDTPCQSLKVAMKKVPKNGTVVIRGSQYLNQAVEIDRSVIIRGALGATLFPTKKSTILQAFFISSQIDVHYRVSLVSLRIQGVGLLNLSNQKPRRGTITIAKCQCFKGNSGAEQSFIHGEDKFYPIKLRIANAYFASIKYMIPSLSLISVSVEDCRFNKTGKILFKIYQLKIKNSMFINVMKIWVRQMQRQLQRQKVPMRVSIADTLAINSDFKIDGSKFSGSLSISRCEFSSKKSSKTNAIQMKEFLKVNVVGVLCRESKSQPGCMKIIKFHNVFVKGSEFISNEATRGAGLNIKLSPNVTVTNCRFINNSAIHGGAVVIESSNVDFINCTFVKNKAFTKGGALHAHSMGKSNNLVRLLNCSFQMNMAGVGGAIAMDRYSLVIKYSKLIDNRADLAAGGLSAIAKNSASVIVRDTLFINNSASAIHIMYASQIILANIRVVATSDSSIYHMRLKAGFISLQSVHADIRHPSLESRIKSNMVQNVMSLSSSKRFIKSTNMYFSCSRYFFVDIQQKKVKGSDVEVKCATCVPNEYSLTNSLKVHKLLQTTQSKEHLYQKAFCQSCPTGAICNGFIKVLDNYWGAKNVDDSLEVFPCPRGYCCSQISTPCVSHNTCHQGREGTLCGRCKVGFVQSFLDENCIPKGSRKCNITLFIVYVILVSLMYTLGLTFLPEIVTSLKRIRCTRVCQKTESTKEKGEVYDMIMMRRTGTLIDTKPVVPLSAVLTQIVFFFQLASLVHIEILQHGTEHTTQESDIIFTHLLFDVFNFRFTVYRNVCPTDEMTFVLKLFIDLALKMTTLVNVLLIYIFYKALTIIWCHRQTSRSNRSRAEVMRMSTVSTTSQCLTDTPSLTDGTSIVVPNETSLAFTSQLKIGFLKLLKLNFTSTALILLQLVHCEKIHDQLHLYVSGNYVCYVWWQWFIMVILLPIMAMFPFSFGKALDKLKDGKISTNVFLLSCVIPFAFAIWARKVRTDGPGVSNDEKKCIKEILELEEELFATNHNGFRWPVIQLYRMLAIVLVDTIVLNPIFKSQWFFVMFLSFFAHDWYRMPYEHPFLNLLQRLTSACLFLVNVCSNPSAFSSVGNISSVPNMNKWLHVLRYTELFVYCVVLLSLPVWKMWTKIRRSRTERNSDSDDTISREN